MLGRDGVDNDAGVGVTTGVLNESCDTSCDSVDAVNASIGKRSRCDGDAAAEGSHHVPNLIALGPGCFPVLVALDDRDDDVNTALRPPIGNDGAAESSLKVSSEVSLARVAEIATSFVCCKRGILDMCRQDDVRRERT